MYCGAGQPLITHCLDQAGGGGGGVNKGPSVVSTACVWNWITACYNCEK